MPDELMNIQTTTKMKTAITSILTALAFVALVWLVGCEKEQPEPQVKTYEPYELIRMKASGAEVTEGRLHKLQGKHKYNQLQGRGSTNKHNSDI